MPRKGENIYRRADGRWEGRYICGKNVLTGKSKYGYVYAKSYSACKKRKFQAEQSSTCPAEKSMTLSQCAELWLHEKRATQQIHPGTVKQFEHHLCKHILPALGNVRVCNLDSTVISEFGIRQLCAGRLDNKGGLSTTVVKTQMVILSGILKYALRLHYVSGIPEFPKIKQAPEKKYEPRVVEKWEQLVLENALQKELQKNTTHYDLCLGVLMALYTGLRVGELAGLQWSDINFENKIITVHHTLQRLQISSDHGAKTAIILGPPKTESSLCRFHGVGQGNCAF